MSFDGSSASDLVRSSLRATTTWTREEVERGVADLNRRIDRLLATDREATVRAQAGGNSPGKTTHVCRELLRALAPVSRDPLLRTHSIQRCGVHWLVLDNLGSFHDRC